MSTSFDLSDPSKVTVGTVGLPGQRIFFLQARQGDQLVTLKLEKQHVALLVTGLTELLADLAGAKLGEEPDLNLEEPAVADWAVGAMQLTYDPGGDRVVLLAEEVDPGIPLIDDEPAISTILDDVPVAEGVARFAMTRKQAVGLIHRGDELLQAGRPRCDLCGYPIDASGHSCPKTNGHRPPSL